MTNLAAAADLKSVLGLPDDFSLEELPRTERRKLEEIVRNVLVRRAYRQLKPEVGDVAAMLQLVEDNNLRYHQVRYIIYKR